MKVLFLSLIFTFSTILEAREALSSKRYELLSGIRKGNKNKNAKAFWDKKYSKSNYVFGKKPARFLSRNYDYIPAGAKVLDVGMGEGRHAVFLARKGYKVTGVDISSVAVKKAGPWPVSLVFGSIQLLPVWKSIRSSQARLMPSFVSTT